jgi:hypothetical protein
MRSEFDANNRPASMESPGGSSSKPLLIVIGCIAIVIPLLQAYFAFQQYFALSSFLGTDVLIQQFLSSMVMTHPAVLAGLLMVVGGILLILQNRWGYLLVVSSMAFSLFWNAESMAIMAYSMLKYPQMNGMVMDIAFEYLAMTYYTAIIVFVLQVVSLIILSGRKQRIHLQLRKKDRWMVLGIFLFLIVDLHATLLYFYLMRS